MAGETPINAHQQSSVPLLRRPRAPKPAKVEKTTKSKKISLNDPFSSDETWIADELGYLEQGEPDERSNFVIHPLHPKGPSFFPPGNVLHPKNRYELVCDTMDRMTQSPPEATSKHSDIFQRMPPRPVLRTSMSGVVISRQNYKKLTGWFATHVPKQEHLNTLQFNLQVETPPTRKPQHQAIIGTHTLH